MLNDFLNDAYRCSEVALTLHLRDLIKKILEVVENDKATDDPNYRRLALDYLDENGELDWDSINWECLEYWLECYSTCNIICNHPAACALRVQHEIEDAERA